MEEELKKLSVNIVAETAKLDEDSSATIVTQMQVTVADLILKWANEKYQKNEVEELQNELDEANREIEALKEKYESDNE